MVHLRQGSPIYIWRVGAMPWSDGWWRIWNQMVAGDIGIDGGNRRSEARKKKTACIAFTISPDQAKFVHRSEIEL